MQVEGNKTARNLGYFTPENQRASRITQAALERLFQSGSNTFKFVATLKPVEEKQAISFPF